MWAEIHVYEGSMYVTSTFGRSSGVAIGPEVSDEELGNTIKAHVHWWSGSGEFRESERLSREAWTDFCENTVGVPVRRYRPEKRVRAYTPPEGWRIDRMPDHERILPRSTGMAAIGAAVRRELEAIEPTWPMLREVVVLTSSLRQLVLMPIVGGYWVGPVRVLGIGADLASFTTAVTAALADSDATDPSAMADALAAAGLERRLMTGAATVIFDELSHGGAHIRGHGVSGTEVIDQRVWDGRLEDAYAAALDMIRTLPSQHFAPGTPTGTGFGYKCCWLAIRDTPTADVVAALGLRDTRPLDWDEGIDAAYAGGVFVSPPTSGWTFAAGRNWFDDVPDVAALSARLGTEVQFFGTHRVSEYHEWALAAGGRLIRRLRCEGMSGTFEQEGVPTEIEIELEVPAMTVQGWRINEQTVMTVSGTWSIDPTRLNLVESSATTGVHGLFAP